MGARIHKPGKTAMQSGLGKTDDWALDFEAEGREIEPLMGWTSSNDTQSQVSLRFGSKEDAMAYCTANGIPFRVEEPKESIRKAVSYSDNFKSNRIGLWTH